MHPGPLTHILVVDDDPEIRALLRAHLEQEGFLITEAADGDAAEAVLEADPIDLVTLDIALAHESGLALARRIRERWAVPIIMLTGRGDEIDRVLGLELGADDYMTKPFSVRELTARVRAVLRRTVHDRTTPAPQSTTIAESTACLLRFSGGVLDPMSRVYRRTSGEVVDLTTAEFSLLELFLRHPQRVLSRDAIMNALRGHDWDHFDRSIDTAVTRLRKKCEPDPAKPVFIKTVRGAGYMFSAPVERAAS